MRLTNRNIVLQSRSLTDTEEEYKKHEKDDLEYRKLWELENIEEELGIDLIILFKALKNGVYFKGDNELKDVKLRMYHEEPMLVHTIDNSCEEEVYVCGYGKIWALTKEELELCL